MVAAIRHPAVQTLSPTASSSGAGLEAEEGGLTPDTVEEEVVVDGPLYLGPAEAEARGCTAVADCP